MRQIINVFAYFFHDVGIYRASFSISIPMGAAPSPSPFRIPSTRKSIIERVIEMLMTFKFIW